MVLIKPNFDGSDMDSNRYNGPPPTPGPYHGVVKQVWATKIKSGDNAGAPQIKVLIEIDQGKFKGAGIFENFNLITQNAWSVNQFLDALTDGSEKQRTTLRKWFWQIGIDAEPESDKVGQKVTKIGKKFVPNGKPVSFITKMDNSVEPAQARIDRFVVPLEGGGAEEPAEEDNSEALGEFDAATTSNPEPAVAEEESAPPPVSDDDDDDPWS